MRFFLLTVLAISFTIQGFAQVAAPSLDPSQASVLPSVTPWRLYNTGAFNYSTGSIDRDNFEAEITVMGGILALNLDGFGLEAYTDMVDFEGKSGSYVTTSEGGTTQFALSYKFGELLSAGLGQVSYTDNMETKLNGSVVNEEETEITGNMMGANINLGEIFFLGLGINIFKSQGTEGSSDKQEVEWQETILGAAVLIGEPGQLQFKAEYSTESNPEVTEDASGSIVANYVKKTDTSKIILEVKSDQYFASFASRTKTEAEIDSKYGSGYEEEKTSTSTLGIGFINDEGLMVTGYSESEKKVTKETGGDEEQKSAMIGVNVGYNF